VHLKTPNNKFLPEGLYHLLATTFNPGARASLVHDICSSRASAVQLRWLTDRQGSPLRTLFEPTGAEYAPICVSLRVRQNGRWHADHLGVVGEKRENNKKKWVKN
jgi:hypothetical protein